MKAKIVNAFDNRFLTQCTFGAQGRCAKIDLDELYARELRNAAFQGQGAICTIHAFDLEL